MNRYLRAASIALGTVAFAAVPVFADNTASNTNTGNNSNNLASATSDVDCQSEQTNNLTISNTITSVSNSGGNQANNNTGDATIGTGDATSDVDVTNAGNSNDATVICLSASNVATNSATGNNSFNTVNATSTKKLKAKQNNTAEVGNNVNRRSRTGRNRANGNTGAANVTTGTASGGAIVTNDPINTNTSNVGP